ncbi:hypothetical protein HNY73_005027 [Argiope bruennichi]|uniref:Uncharacterized protein n=1 Tax=Argiope bruennichi TaxID=94029 RepID=A0A8T0FG43_ARGBR|nr:hypothetical protein HNY73_005027 [Argiope bruennichi]
MAFLGKALKADLQKLAENLGVVVGASSTVCLIKTAIQAMPNFEKEVDYIKELLETLRTARRNSTTTQETLMVIGQTFCMNYFEEWFKGLEIKTFAALSDLMVT